MLKYRLTVILCEDMNNMEDITFKVPFTTVLSVRKHPNADKLSICTVYGFEVVTRLDAYKPGNEIIFVPPDSILPSWLEAKLFDANSKIRLNKSRVRQIRIRGFPSQGLIIDVEDVADHLGMDKTRRLGSYDIEEDLSGYLGITKYEPPVNLSTPKSLIKRNKPLENKYFHKYDKFPNIKWYPDLFEGDMVSITEKLHGSNFRAGWVPNYPKSLLDKIKKVFGLLPEWEFTFGSHNVQLQARKTYTGFYEENVYKKIAEQYDLKNRLLFGEVLYGEIIGSGIQDNYTYGCAPGEHKLVVFDLKKQSTNSSEYVSVEEFRNWCLVNKFEAAPTLYIGPWDKDLAYSLTKGPSVYCPEQPVREGIVIKSVTTDKCYIGRKVVKWVSEAYLGDHSNSDNH